MAVLAQGALPEGGCSVRAGPSAGFPSASGAARSARPVSASAPTWLAALGPGGRVAIGAFASAQARTASRPQAARAPTATGGSGGAAHWDRSHLRGNGPSAQFQKKYRHPGSVVASAFKSCSLTAELFCLFESFLGVRAFRSWRATPPTSPRRPRAPSRSCSPGPEKLSVPGRGPTCVPFPLGRAPPACPSHLAGPHPPPSHSGGLQSALCHPHLLPHRACAPSHYDCSEGRGGRARTASWEDRHHGHPRTATLPRAKGALPRPGALVGGLARAAAGVAGVAPRVRALPGASPHGMRGPTWLPKFYLRR